MAFELAKLFEALCQFSMFQRFNTAYMGLVNPVLHRDNYLFSWVLSYLRYLIRCKSGSSVFLAKGMAFFNDSIFVVLISRSWCEVVWINAVRNITRMHKNHSIWNFSFVKLVTVSVSPDSDFSRKKENTIAKLICSSGPEPTSGSFIHSHQEDIRWSNNWIFTEPALSPHPVIAGLTKLSANRFFMPAYDAWNRKFLKVGQWHLLNA